ncbi:PREDICTED: protein ROOT PRIMORDIUM DEFECTIVE 1 [Fragaria vesca subsp. vesca]|uniref:protein ROOT PRIMORDIUM DEFECTIVE 1 n=1 Tax=Fragaria vesca subsp. vesca TaxID=101020 RepID=UPI0002C33041|nr:PREDICTED: protein ROOT PRIMORDIUM DEFECTIVE 1 [Fragaria vesca subsp. vesca]
MPLFHIPSRSVLKPHHHHRHIIRRTFIDTTTINWVRDRGLDHVVEREKNLRPIINIKNLIKSEPSKSLPISILTKSRHSLQIPTRPVNFVRQFPSIFEEFLPGGIPGGIASVQPHLRLTPQLLDIDSKEHLMYQSHSYTHQAADRLFKMLMLVRCNRLPLNLIELFKWDLGLPEDYVETIVPEFPDYFKVAVGKYGLLELEMVCWSDELATSVMEKKNKAAKGMPVAFPMQFSRGFEMDKKMKKWIDEWQKLPYVSPYENAAHLSSQSDESDKWAVAVLHELLHILVPKKTDRENILALGEYLGIRSRFKRALLHHPGILHVSSKNRTYTVVLREGYKRGAIIENHPLMDIRNEYIHLMNAVKEDGKGVSPREKRKRKKGVEDPIREDIDEDDDENEEEEGYLCDSSDAEVEHDEVDSEDNEEEDEDDDEDEEESMSNIWMNDANTRGRRARKSNFDVMTPSRNAGRGSSGQKRAWKSDNAERGGSGGQYPGRRGERVSPDTSRTTQSDVRHNVRQNTTEGSNLSRSRVRSSPDKKTYI